MSYDLGFLGGGQLARMSIQAAQRMGLTCLSLDPGAVTPASQVAESVRGSLSDPFAIEEVFAQCDRVTLENEFIPAACIEEALKKAGRSENSLVPGLKTLSEIQDKLRQREAYARHGVPSPDAWPLEKNCHLDAYPRVLKARFGGYDGKGTRYVKDSDEFEELRPVWSQGGWMVEEFVPFKRELAVMVVSTDRGCYAFPTVETVQRNYVCDLVFPTDCDASSVAISAVRAVEGQGIFGVELFELNNGAILVNEIAPRPHNTGHYTLDWGGPSQFEAHVRAVCGFAAPQPRSESFAVMVNLLGTDGGLNYLAGLRAALEVPGAFVHWYGKAESRAGRKMGHINVVGNTPERVDNVVQRALEARERFFQAALDPL